MAAVNLAERLTACPSSEDGEGPNLDKPGAEDEASDAILKRAPNFLEIAFARVFGGAFIQCVEDGRTSCALAMVRALARLRAERLVALVMEGIAVELDRADVAAGLLLQLVEEGATQDAAFMAAAPVRRGRLAALLNVFDWLLRSKQVLSAANLVLELVRHGEAPVVADVLIAVVHCGDIADARDLTAVLIARGHADEAALVDLWIIYVGEAAAVAQITAAIVDAGGLSLACEAKAAMVSLGEWLAGSPCYELVRMGRVDVVARMVIALVNTRHTRVVCACFEGLVLSGNQDALAEVALTVAEMDRPDIIATVLVTLVQMGDLDLAKQCMAALIKSGFPWVAATAKVEMVRQGHLQVAAMIQGVLSREGEDKAILEVAVLLLRGGFATEWAAIARAHISAGEADIVARQLAGLVKTGRPDLTVEAACALAQTAGAKSVAEVVEQMVTERQVDAAADLAADMAQRAPSLACNVFVQLVNQGHAGTAALLLLRLLDSGRIAAVVAINNALIAHGRTKEAAAIAGALAAQTDVLALMSALKGAGAQILPEVWHRETTRYVANTAAAVFPAAAAGAKSGATTGARARSGNQEMATPTETETVVFEEDEMRETRELFAAKTAAAATQERALRRQGPIGTQAGAAQGQIFDTAHKDA